MKKFNDWHQKYIAFGLAFVSIFCASQNVFAEDLSPSVNGNQVVDDVTGTATINSTGKIQLTPGELQIINAPDLNFGSHNLYSQDTYNLVPEDAANPRTLEIGDQTAGETGWTVMVAMSKFQDKTNPDNVITMPVTSMKFNSAKLVTKATEAEEWHDASSGDSGPANALTNMSILPPTADVFETHSNVDSTGSDTGKSVITGQSVKVFDANSISGEQTFGKGFWGLDFDQKNSIQLLSNKQRQEAGDYHATLVWTLQAGPTFDANNSKLGSQTNVVGWDQAASDSTESASASSGSSAAKASSASSTAKAANND